MKRFRLGKIVAAGAHRVRKEEERYWSISLTQLVQKYLPLCKSLQHYSKFPFEMTLFRYWCLGVFKSGL